VSTYEVMIVIGMAVWIVIGTGIMIALFYAIGLIRGMRPALTHLEKASETASRVASSLSEDAEGVGKALRNAGESTERMVDLVEDRVAEAAALLEVVQEEAEETFLTTASLLRGLRRGKKKVSAGRRVTRAIGNLRR